MHRLELGAAAATRVGPVGISPDYGYRLHAFAKGQQVALIFEQHDALLGHLQGRGLVGGGVVGPGGALGAAQHIGGVHHPQDAPHLVINEGQQSGVGFGGFQGGAGQEKRS